MSKKTRKQDFDLIEKVKKNLVFWENNSWIPFSSYFQKKAEDELDSIFIKVWACENPTYEECPFFMDNCPKNRKGMVFNYLILELDTFEKFNWISSYQNLFDEEQKKILRKKLESISETYINTLKNSGQYPKFLKENFKHFPDNKKKYALGALKSLIAKAKIPKKRIILSEIGPILAQKVGIEYWEEFSKDVEAGEETLKIIAELFGTNSLALLMSGQQNLTPNLLKFLSNLEYLLKEKLKKELTLPQKIEKIKGYFPGFMKRNPDVFENLIKKHISANEIEVIFDLTPEWFGKNSEQFQKIMSLFILSLEIRPFVREIEVYYYRKYQQYPKIIDAVYIGT